MFPLQRGNELVIEFSNSHHSHQHQHKISEDLILDADYDDSLQSKKILFYEAAADTSNNCDEHKKKQIVHKEIERQRRQEMATLHASLRSLLPLQFIKGKRSISDQINEAVNYIKHLQKNIKEVSGKRDELKKISNSKLQNRETKYASSSTVTVHQNNGAIGIEIITSYCSSDEEGFPLSKLLELLFQEGLELVTCLSTRVNGRLLHSLQCEVNNSNGVDLSELRRKFLKVIPSFNFSD